MVTTIAYHASQDVRDGSRVKLQQDKVATAVYVTTDYSRFKFDEHNRPIDPNKLTKLYDAVSKRNLLADHPIMVDLDYNILDGQHRLRVAEALEVPIYYYFASDTNISDIPNLQMRRAGWKGTDYLWAHRDNENYIRLAEFRRRYSWIPVRIAMDLCNYGDKGNLTESFANGMYECNDFDFGVRVAEALLDFRRAGFSHWNSRVFTYAVAHLLANSDYDHSIMLDKLRYNSSALRPAVNSDDYFVMFNKIYNYKARGNKLELCKLSVNDPRYRADKKAEKEKLIAD